MAREVGLKSVFNDCYNKAINAQEELIVQSDLKDSTLVNQFLSELPDIISQELAPRCESYIDLIINLKITRRNLTDCMNKNIEVFGPVLDLGNYCECRTESINSYIRNNPESINAALDHTRLIAEYPDIIYHFINCAKLIGLDESANEIKKLKTNYILQLDLYRRTPEFHQNHDISVYEQCIKEHYQSMSLNEYMEHLRAPDMKILRMQKKCMDDSRLE